MQSFDNFLFDLLGQLTSGLVIDAKTVLASLLVIGFVIFGLNILLRAFGGYSPSDSFEEDHGGSGGSMKGIWNSGDKHYYSSRFDNFKESHNRDDFKEYSGNDFSDSNER